MSDDNHSNVPTLPPPAVLRDRIDKQRTRIFQAQGIVNLATAAADEQAQSDLEMALQAVSELLGDIDMKLDWDALLEEPKAWEGKPTGSQEVQS